MQHNNLNYYVTDGGEEEVVELLATEPMHALTSEHEYSIRGEEKEQWEYMIILKSDKYDEFDSGLEPPMFNYYNQPGIGSVNSDNDLPSVPEQAPTTLKKKLSFPALSIRTTLQNRKMQKTARAQKRAKRKKVMIRRLKQVGLIEEAGGGFVPYSKGAHEKGMFRPFSATSFFSSLQKQRIIRRVIEDTREDGGAEINLNYEKEHKVIDSYMPLHEEATRKELIKNWGSLRNAYTSAQPLDLIRTYFGEELSFYFAWLGYYTNWLVVASVVGVIAFILAELEEKEEYGWSAVGYSIFLSFWATFFVEFWKRKNSELAFKWDMLHYEESESVRNEFNGAWVKGSYYKGEFIAVSEELEEMIMNVAKATIHKSFKIDNEPGAAENQIKAPQASAVSRLQTKYYPERTRFWRIVAGTPFVILMVVVTIIATVSILTFRLWMEVKQLHLLGAAIGGIANAITIVILNHVYKRVAVLLNKWENHRTETEFREKLIVKMFIFQFVNSYTSLYYIAFLKNGTELWGKSDLKDGCNDGSDDGLLDGCMIDLTVQLGSIFLTNMFLGQFVEIILPHVTSRLRILWRRCSTLTKLVKLSRFEELAQLSEYEGTFDEYNEMVLQFGYITLFATAFPLAPLFALANNLVEIRTDALKFLVSTRRPDYHGAANIGLWQHILEIIGVLAVVTNAVLIGFSSDVIENLFDKDVIQIIISVVLLEHAILFTKYIISILISDVPKRVREEIAKKEFIKEMILKQLRYEEEGCPCYVDLEEYDDSQWWNMASI